MRVSGWRSERKAKVSACFASFFWMTSSSPCSIAWSTISASATRASWSSMVFLGGRPLAGAGLSAGGVSPVSVESGGCVASDPGAALRGGWRRPSAIRSRRARARVDSERPVASTAWDFEWVGFASQWLRACCRRAAPIDTCFFVTVLRAFWRSRRVGADIG